MLLIALPERQTATFRSEGLEEPRQAPALRAGHPRLLPSMVAIRLRPGGGATRRPAAVRVQPAAQDRRFKDAAFGTFGALAALAACIPRCLLLLAGEGPCGALACPPHAALRAGT